MIIFGTRGVKSTKETGQFNCPQCERQTGYRHRKVTKFFTLYFIPLIPLGSAGEYVECNQCKCTFIPRVLDNSPSTPNNDREAFIAIYEKAIKHSMVLIMLADGVVEEAEKVQVLKVINQYSHNDMTMKELEEYIAQLQNSIEKTNTYLASIGPMLNEHGKEEIIKAALSVAASDGHIDGTEIDEIEEMGKAMEMSKAHISGILASVKQPASLN